ncbi:MAG TPA: hypothetical protein VJS30_03965 [Paraburkholderia sp.]|nr:hypothetical protein [Paraburkholderia sp.]
MTRQRKKISGLHELTNVFSKALSSRFLILDCNRESMKRIMSYLSDKVQGEISIYSIRETDNMAIPNIDKILSLLIFAQFIFASRSFRICVNTRTRSQQTHARASASITNYLARNPPRDLSGCLP